MYLEILTPEKKLFDDEIKQVEVPGSLGRFEMLNNHAPIVSSLVQGNIKITKNSGDKENIEIKSGVIECHSNKIKILAEQ